MELATVVGSGDTRQESPRSPPLVVIVSASAELTMLTGSGSLALSGRSPSGTAVAESVCFTPDGSCYTLERVARDLEVGTRPLTALPDGRLLFGAGAAIQTTTPGGTTANWTVEPPCRDASADVRLLSALPDATFVQSGLVYLAWQCKGSGGRSVALVTRYREINGVLGEAAVLDSIDFQSLPILGLVAARAAGVQFFVAATGEPAVLEPVIGEEKTDTFRALWAIPRAGAMARQPHRGGVLVATNDGKLIRVGPSGPEAAADRFDVVRSLSVDDSTTVDGKATVYAVSDDGRSLLKMPLESHDSQLAVSAGSKADLSSLGFLVSVMLSPVDRALYLFVVEGTFSADLASPHITLFKTVR